jgi:hypothetical protein
MFVSISVHEVGGGQVMGKRGHECDLVCCAVLCRAVLCSGVPGCVSARAA